MKNRSHQTTGGARARRSLSLSLSPAPPPPLSRRAGLYRDRDAHPHQDHARGRARLPGAQPRAPRQVLRPAPVAAAVQADADDRRVRPLFPDRPLLPRRGPARRPPARVHPARHGDVLRGPRRTSSQLIGGPDAHAGQADVPAWRILHTPFPRHHLRRGDGALRHATSRTCASAWSSSDLTDIVAGVEFRVFAGAARRRRPGQGHLRPGLRRATPAARWTS